MFKELQEYMQSTSTDQQATDAQAAKLPRPNDLLAQMVRMHIRVGNMDMEKLLGHVTLRAGVVWLLLQAVMERGQLNASEYAREVMKKAVARRYPAK